MANQNNNQNHRKVPIDESTDDKEEEYKEQVSRKRRRATAEEDCRHWKTGMRTEISKFYGNLHVEEFLDQLATVEKILEFNRVIEYKRVPLVATRL